MTQKDKELLLKDLCARIPYGVKANIPLVDGDERIYTISFDDMKDFVKGYINIKPCLRPMSSMTEEEKRFLVDLNLEYEGVFNKSEFYLKYFDWLNKHHFDYRGLIPKGLALKAPKDMYNTKTE